MTQRHTIGGLLLFLLLAAAPVAQQSSAPAPRSGQRASGGSFWAVGMEPLPLPTEPLILDTHEQKIRVVVVAKGFAHPWSVAFLPDGSMLVT
jgi:glucose/arabinose dehydrogenase